MNDLSVGYSCVRKLVKLDEVQFVLNNHTSEHFPFLGNSVAITEMRCRSMFYTSLGRLLMVDLGEDEDRFHTFMLPLTGLNNQSRFVAKIGSVLIIFSKLLLNFDFVSLSGTNLKIELFEHYPISDNAEILHATLILVTIGYSKIL